MGLQSPCGEIDLCDPQPVRPWVQLQMMNFARVRQGLPVYTREEAKQIVTHLGGDLGEVAKIKDLK